MTDGGRRSRFHRLREPRRGARPSHRRPALLRSPALRGAVAPTPETATAAASLRGIAGLDPTDSPATPSFSILRVCGPSVLMAEVDEAESHFQRALITRQHGLNRN